MINKRKITPYPLYNPGSPLLSDYIGNLELFIGKPFWRWDQGKHNQEFIKTTGQRCFNRIVGLPIKNNKEYNIFDFQKSKFTITNYKNCIIVTFTNKSTTSS